MPQPISSTEIQKLITTVEGGNITVAYDFLVNKGYQYASWANGVAKGDTLAGASALVFLESTAMMGMGINSLACQTLSPEILKARVGPISAA